MPLSKKLQAIDHALTDRNRRESAVVLRDSRSWAPTAPVQEDSMRCRWCRGRLLVLQDSARSVYCQSGCSQTHVFECWCEECRRKFETGKQGAILCYECERKEGGAFVGRGGDVTPGPVKSFRRGDRNYRA